MHNCSAVRDQWFALAKLSIETLDAPNKPEWDAKAAAYTRSPLYSPRIWTPARQSGRRVAASKAARSKLAGRPHLVHYVEKRYVATDDLDHTPERDAPAWTAGSTRSGAPDGA